MHSEGDGKSVVVYLPNSPLNLIESRSKQVLNLFETGPIYL